MHKYPLQAAHQSLLATVRLSPDNDVANMQLMNVSTTSADPVERVRHTLGPHSGSSIITQRLPSSLRNDMYVY
jgi:hypothetical protein